MAESGSVAIDDDARADGAIVALVDQDEAAGGAVAAVFVAEQRLRRPQLDPADLVEAELVGGLVAVQRVDVEPVVAAP